jgi:hypothetical protein
MWNVVDWKLSGWSGDYYLGRESRISMAGRVKKKILVVVQEGAVRCLFLFNLAARYSL